LRNRKTKQQLVDDNEQAARIALYLPQLHAQKEKLEADLQELEHLALSGPGFRTLAFILSLATLFLPSSSAAFRFA
jgi:hypothetical protein